MMRPDAKVQKVYLYPKPVDFRKPINGLAALVDCGFHAIRPPSPLSSGQAFHGHLATCSTAIRPGSRSAATLGWHC